MIIELMASNTCSKFKNRPCTGVISSNPSAESPAVDVVLRPRSAKVLGADAILAILTTALI